MPFVSTRTQGRFVIRYNGRNVYWPGIKSTIMKIDDLPPRLQREHKTFLAMQMIYCRAHHGSKDDLCPDCAELSAYAFTRLEKCPFQEQKPVCARCPIHCYQKEMQNRVKKMMRYSGPRMMFRHPGMAFLHLMNRFRKLPSIKR